MENQISQQLSALGASLALGAAAGLLYDVLRAVRLLRRRTLWLTHFLDIVFVLSAAAGLLYLMLRLGGGELRLFMLAGAALGLLLWGAVLSKPFRPIWDFWAATLAALGRLLWRPVQWAALGGKKLAACGRKGFSFTKKYATMRIEAARRRRYTQEKEATVMAEGKKPKKAKKRRSGVLLVVLALVVVALGVEIVKVYTQLNSAKAEEAALEAQRTEQQQVNDSLRSDLAKKDDDTFWKALARDLLGLAEEGERIFYDVND